MKRNRDDDLSTTEDVRSMFAHQQTEASGNGPPAAVLQRVHNPAQRPLVDAD